jgi:alpha-1,6-mannosyltransferase
MIGRTASRLPLWLPGLLSLGGYGIMALWFPLVPHAAEHPTRDVRSFAPTLAAGLAYAGLLCLLFGLQYWLYRQVKERAGCLGLRAILLTGALYALPLLFTYPITATDLYRYFIRGRVAVVHQADPFSVPVSDLADEPYRELAGEWATDTSPYGPLWELIAGRVVAAVPDDPALALLLFKGLAVAAFLASAALIWSLSVQSGRARQAALTALWAWNPALLLTFAVNGHNDGLMILWLLLGWWLIRRGRCQWGLLVALLGPLTKPIALLALPFFVLAAWRQVSPAWARWRLLLATAVAGAALAWLAFLPFGAPLALARRLLSESGSGGGFSPVAALILLGRALGGDPPVEVYVNIGTGVFGLLALWLLWRTWRGRTALRGAADIFAAYVAQAFRYRIWYAAWPFAWLLLDHAEADGPPAVSAARLAAGQTFLLASQLSVVLYGQIRVSMLGGSMVAAHLIGVPFTFLAPLVAAAAVFYARSHGRRRGI